jgi:Uma2 family endonuclease
MATGVMTLIAEPNLRRWTLDEFQQMGEMGFFTDERVELIDGEIIEMPPQKDVHAIVVSLVDKTFSKALPSGFWVRSQLPLHLGDASEPEPDLSIVKGNPRDYLGKGHPKSALLVAEVSDSTLQFDRTIKASLYAAAGIGDYWIVNLNDRCVEVCRDPIVDSSAKFGFSYSSRTVHRAQETIKSLLVPGEIAIADILP